MIAVKEKKATKKRYNILGLIFITVVINYMDRSNISVAAAALREELELSTLQMGLVFSAFAWTYSSLQIPGGILVDYIRPRILYPFMLVFWSAATIVQGAVNSFAVLLGLRTAVGLFEAPSYPCNNRIVSTWFPDQERASAIAVYTSGQFIGLAFLTPALILVQNYLGWRGLFISTGLLGMVWAVVWYVLYRDPQNHATANQAELRHIEAGGGIASNTSDELKRPFSWADLGQAFVHRKLWGLYLGQFCLGSLFIFFLTWFPTYLVEFRGMDFIKSGFLASIPFLAAFVGVLLSGFTSDFLVKKGYSSELARKTPVLIGMLLSLAIIAANYTESNAWVIFYLSLAFFGNGLASIAWVFISLISPNRLIGLVGGVFNFFGGLAAVITPIMIGYLVEEGDFRPALLYIGLMAFLGFCAYMFLVGKVERIEIAEISSSQH